MFDSLKASSTQPKKALAKLYMYRDICNMMCCKGLAQIKRHELLANWWDPLTSGHCKRDPMRLSKKICLLTLFSTYI